MATKQHKASCRSLTALSSFSLSLSLCFSLYKIDGNFPRIGETIGEKNRGNKPRFHRAASRRVVHTNGRGFTWTNGFAPFTTELEQTIQCKKWLGPLRQGHFESQDELLVHLMQITSTLVVCYQVIGTSWRWRFFLTILIRPTLITFLERKRVKSRKSIGQLELEISRQNQFFLICSRLE